MSARLTDKHFNLITTLSDVLSRTSEAREEVMCLLNTTAPKAPPFSRRRLRADLVRLLETLWALEGEVCMAASELTGLSVAVSANEHAAQLGMLAAAGDPNRAALEVTDAVAAFTKP